MSPSERELAALERRAFGFFLPFEEEKREPTPLGSLGRRASMAASLMVHHGAKGEGGAGAPSFDGASFDGGASSVIAGAVAADEATAAEEVSGELTWTRLIQVTQPPP